MPHDTSLLALLAGALVLAFVLGMIAHRFRLSPLVGYLLAGIVVGPFTPGFVGDAELASKLAEIGVILLMFGVGLHFSLDDLREVRRTAFPYAIVPIITSAVLGCALGFTQGWTAWQGIVFGLALSVASSVVALRAMEDHGLMETTRGKTAIGWTVVEDLVMVLVLVLLPVLAAASRDGDHAIDSSALLALLGITLAKLVLFAALLFVVGRRVVPWLLRKVAGTGSRELFSLSVLSMALGVAFASAEWFGVSIALGAFFAGMLLNESELSHQAAADSLPMRDAFAVVFFVSVGMLFDPLILVQQPLLVIATVLVIMVGKPAVAYGLLILSGRPKSTALTIAATVSQIGEFSFILAGLAVALKLLPPEGRDLVLAGALISIVANPIVFAALERWHDQQEALLPPDARPRDPAAGPAFPSDAHTILVGYGRVGAQLALLLRQRGVPVVVIDSDGDLVHRAHADGFPALRGNAASMDRMEELSPATATHALVAIPQAIEAGEIVAHLRHANPTMVILARAHSEAALRHLIEQGADGAVLAEVELAYSMAEMVMGARGTATTSPALPVTPS